MGKKTSVSVAVRCLLWCTALLAAGGLLLAAWVYSGSAQALQMPTPPATTPLPAPTHTIWLVAAAGAPTNTPFQPVANTATLTLTPTATATFTPPPSPSPSASPTATEPPPTSTATPTSGPDFPPSARINGISGWPQTLNLSCESRSAVDWAAYYGVSIGELTFQDALPRSDNPNRGFVGDPNGLRGQVPPASYGVHAPPVAALLRDYGLPASDYRGLSLDDLRQAVANGNPVIVWVIGDVWSGYAQTYTAADGESVIVAANEHTVILIGYNESTVTVLDGSLVYSPTIERFLDSWGVLGNAGILYGR